MTTKAEQIQLFFDEAVANGVAPGFQFAVFDKSNILVSGASGYGTFPSKDAPDGIPTKEDSILWIASCTKIVTCLLVLIILERKLCKSDITLADLDDHEKLVEILPEFKHGSGTLLTKIIDGFEVELGSDGKKIPILHDAKGKVTLRMLLTHTSGLSYPVFNPLIKEVYYPSDGSVPIKGPVGSTGAIKDMEIPLIFEPGTANSYGYSTEWLGQFAVRALGMDLRNAFKKYIFEPLGVAPSELDLFVTPELQQKSVPVYVRAPDATFSAFPLSIYSTENEPPEGYMYDAGAGLYGSVRGYAKILQAALRHDSKILKASTWELAVADDLTKRGVKMSVPKWKSFVPVFSSDVDYYALSTDPLNASSFNLLQCEVATAPTLSGRPVGSYGWAGLANTWYIIDESTEKGYVLSAQLLPFADPRVIEMRDDFERLLYSLF